MWVATFRGVAQGPIVAGGTAATARCRWTVAIIVFGLRQDAVEFVVTAADQPCPDSIEFHLRRVAFECQARSRAPLWALVQEKPEIT